MLNGRLIKDMFGRPLKVFGYVRLSAIEQDGDYQERGILELADRHGLKVDKVIKETVSGMTSYKDRDLGKMVEGFQEGDTLIVSELSRIGKSMEEVISLLSELTNRGAKIYEVKNEYSFDNSSHSKILLTALNLTVEVERDLKSIRTKEALQRMRKDVKLGRPIGKLGKSKLNGKEEQIRKFLKEDRFSRSRIARDMGVARHIIDYFIKTRNLE